MEEIIIKACRLTGFNPADLLAYKIDKDIAELILIAPDGRKLSFSLDQLKESKVEVISEPDNLEPSPSTPTSGGRTAVSSKSRGTKSNLPTQSKRRNKSVPVKNRKTNSTSRKKSVIRKSGSNNKSSNAGDIA